VLNQGKLGVTVCS